MAWSFAPSLPFLLKPKPHHDLPVVTIAIVALCVLVWLLQLIHGVPPTNARASTAVDWGGILPLYVLTGEPWRLASALFLHVDIVHLAINMLVLGVMVPRIERVFGWLPTLLVFLVGGILANAGVVAWALLRATPEHFGSLLQVLVGASGGMMALLGALLVPSLLARLGHEPYAEMLGRRIDSSLGWSIAINIGICFVIPGWSPTANVFGALAGVVVGAILLSAPTYRGTAGSLARFAVVGLLLAACVAGIAHAGDPELLGELRTQYDAWRQSQQ